MFFGNSTEAEQSTIQDARIVARAQDAVLTRAPLIGSMRESGVSGQPQPAEDVALNEDGSPTRYWRAGDIVGAYPLSPG